jgi:hypothetical protein
MENKINCVIFAIASKGRYKSLCKLLNSIAGLAGCFYKIEIVVLAQNYSKKEQEQISSHRYTSPTFVDKPFDSIGAIMSDLLKLVVNKANEKDVIVWLDDDCTLYVDILAHTQLVQVLNSSHLAIKNNPYSINIMSLLGVDGAFQATPIITKYWPCLPRGKERGLVLGLQLARLVCSSPIFRQIKMGEDLFVIIIACLMSPKYSQTLHGCSFIENDYAGGSQAPYKNSQFLKMVGAPLNIEGHAWADKNLFGTAKYLKELFDDKPSFNHLFHFKQNIIDIALTKPETARELANSILDGSFQKY